jgi:Thiamine pyrophosphate enzyme, C-terminal TPP binding domain
MTKRILQVYITSGHSACPGCCDIFAAKFMLMCAGPNCIIVNPTGCLEITTTPYPLSSWQVPWIHSLFENAAAVASGIEAALKALGKKNDIKVLVIAGDGATMDIGFGALSGAFERGHDFTYVCMDNEAYMNTGVQRSSGTLCMYGQRSLHEHRSAAQQWNSVRCQHHDKSGWKILLRKSTPKKGYACNYSSPRLSVCSHNFNWLFERYDPQGEKSHRDRRTNLHSRPCTLYNRLGLRYLKNPGNCQTCS